eukprot:gene28776-27350_t
MVTPGGTGAVGIDQQVNPITDPPLLAAYLARLRAVTVSLLSGAEPDLTA